MSFFQLHINKASGLVSHVTEERMISERGVHITDSAGDLQVLDAGFVLDHEWTTSEGEPTTPAHHVWLRLSHQGQPALTFQQAIDVLRGHPEMPKIHACPCTLEGVRAHVRAKGHNVLPAVVRAWLTHTLPPDDIEALGVWRGIPVSALKAVDWIRCKRDARAGSVRVNLERIVQERIDARLEAHHRKHRERLERAMEIARRRGPA